MICTFMSVCFESWFTVPGASKSNPAAVYSPSREREVAYGIAKPLATEALLKSEVARRLLTRLGKNLVRRLQPFIY